MFTSLLTFKYSRQPCSSVKISRFLFYFIFLSLQSFTCKPSVLSSVLSSVTSWTGISAQYFSCFFFLFSLLDFSYVRSPGDSELETRYHFQAKDDSPSPHHPTLLSSLQSSTQNRFLNLIILIIIITIIIIIEATL